VLKGVTFDIDATLYSYPLMVIPRFHRFGIRFADVLYPLTLERREIRKEIDANGPIENYRRRQAELYAQRKGRSVEWAEDFLQRFVYDGWNSSFRGVRLYRGARDFIELLVKNGIKIGIISDYPPGDKMEKMKLTRYPWETVIDCEALGALKPHPLPFRRAAEGMGLDPSGILHVGDKIKFDVKGAAGVGMMTAYRTWIKGRFGTKPPRPDFIFARYRGLRKQVVEAFGLEDVK